MFIHPQQQHPSVHLDHFLFKKFIWIFYSRNRLFFRLNALDLDFFFFQKQVSCVITGFFLNDDDCVLTIMSNKNPNLD